GKPGDHYTKSPGGIVFYDSAGNLGGAVVGGRGQTGSGGSDASGIFGDFGVGGINATNLTGGTMFCYGDNKAVVTTPTGEVVTAVPVKDGTWKTLSGYRYSAGVASDDDGHLAVVDQTDGATNEFGTVPTTISNATQGVG